jgi:hypothetical protein
MTVNKYQFCNISGKGKINRDTAFSIINLSADRIRIKTDAPIELSSKVLLDIALDGGLYQINIKSSGIISKKIFSGYEIRFTGMPEAEKKEINDLVKSSCDLD